MKKWGDLRKNGSIGSSAMLMPRNAAGKRAGPVEDVIAWAWREELPKMPKRPAGPEALRGGWDKTGRYGEYLSLVDLFGVNRFGCVPDFSAESWPCADAVVIGEAVAALDQTTLEMPEDWRPAPELDQFGGLGAKAVSDAWRRMTQQNEAGETVLRLKPSELIVRHVVLGIDADALALDAVTLETERWQNGKERWFIRQVQDRLTGRMVDGVDETVPVTFEANGVNGKGTPLPGAYRKHYLDPDPVPVIIARAEYEILVSALGMVFDLVAGRMEDVVMLPSRMEAEPWGADARQPARVLADLKAERRAADMEREARRDAFARRFPRWFRNLERMAAKMGVEPA